MFQDSVPAGSYNDPFLSSVCVCKPSIAKRAFLLLRLKSSTRSTSSSDSMMRTSATWVWAVSLLLLLLLLEDYCTNVSFRKQKLSQLIKVICV